MLQTGLAGQLLFLIIVCFSLLILSFSNAFHNNNERLRQLSTLFLMPLSAALCLFLFSPVPFSAVLLISSEAFLFLGILVVLQWEGHPRLKKLLLPISLMVPAVFIVLFFISNTVGYPYWLPEFLSCVNIILLLAIPGLMQRKQQYSSHLASAVICMLLTQLLSFLPDSGPARALYLILKAGAYLTFFLYFYYAIDREIMAKVNEAQTILADWDKSVQHAVLKRTIDYEHSQQKLRNMVKIDPLTKCYTKAAVIEVIDTLCRNPDISFTLLMMDIDNFKNINDQLGHLEGDKILVNVSSIILNSIRTIDVLGRYGGDEFILVLPRANIKDGIFVSERLRKRMEEESNCTLSIGLAAFPHDGRSAVEIITSADKGLYISKQKGKNTVTYINAS